MLSKYSGGRALSNHHIKNQSNKGIEAAAYQRNHYLERVLTSEQGSNSNEKITSSFVADLHDP
jgi:hypothetical protein